LIFPHNFFAAMRMKFYGGWLSDGRRRFGAMAFFAQIEAKICYNIRQCQFDE
jgi:hypothetical protein